MAHHYWLWIMNNFELTKANGISEKGLRGLKLTLPKPFLQMAQRYTKGILVNDNMIILKSVIQARREDLKKRNYPIQCGSDRGFNAHRLDLLWLHSLWARPIFDSAHWSSHLMTEVIIPLTSFSSLLRIAAVLGLLNDFLIDLESLITSCKIQKRIESGKNWRQTLS